MGERPEETGTGGRIRAARKKAGFSQSELAKLVGVEGQTISRYERGVIEPSGQSSGRLAEALGCSADWLLTGQDRSADTEDEPNTPGWNRFVEDGFEALYRRRGLEPAQLDYIRRARFRAGPPSGPERYVELAELLLRDPVETSAQESMKRARERRRKKRS